MLLVKLITLKKIKTLYNNCLAFLVFFFIFFIPGPLKVIGQDNSPYSRYGLGDIVPSTNITGRGMGGVSAAYNDPLTINFNNPATYSSFIGYSEARSKKFASGRVILDVGINFDSRTLKDKNVADKFTAYNALFSHLQVGIPVGNKWGISFGLRPLSRISYKINRYERLIDPNTQLPIDSALTQFAGNGGTYLANVGAGYKFGKNFSAGINLGYLFGEKDYSTRRQLINDTIDYALANFQTKTSFGKIFINAGVLFNDTLNKTKAKEKQLVLSIGAYGNMKRNLTASKDVIYETFVRDPNNGDIRLDSVSELKNVKGIIVYPTTFGVGFTIKKPEELKKRGWQLGIDFVQSNWSEYRYYGTMDSVKNNWTLHIGGELTPSNNPANKSYWKAVTYRAGFSYGPDYIQVGNKLSQYGISFGMGLPIATQRGFGRNQYTLINMSLEYGKRGNNNNLLKENLFRLSLGFSLSDIWFIKKKYE